MDIPYSNTSVTDFLTKPQDFYTIPQPQQDNSAKSPFRRASSVRSLTLVDPKFSSQNNPFLSPKFATRKTVQPQLIGQDFGSPRNSASLKTLGSPKGLAFSGAISLQNKFSAPRKLGQAKNHKTSILSTNLDIIDRQIQNLGYKNLGQTQLIKFIFSFAKICCNLEDEQNMSDSIQQVKMKRGKHRKNASLGQYDFRNNLASPMRGSSMISPKPVDSKIFATTTSIAETVESNHKLNHNRANSLSEFDLHKTIRETRAGLQSMQPYQYYTSQISGKNQGQRKQVSQAVEHLGRIHDLEAQNASLRNEVINLQKKNQKLWEGESQNLLKMLQESDFLIETMQKELEHVKSENVGLKSLLETQSFKSAAQQKNKYDEKIKKLKMALQRVAKGFQTHELKALKEQVADFEEANETLHQQNLNLKRDLVSEKKENHTQQQIIERLKISAVEARTLSEHIAGLERFGKKLVNGKPYDIADLVGEMGPDSLRVEELDFFDEFRTWKKRFDNLRGSVCDFLAQSVATSCKIS